MTLLFCGVLCLHAWCDLTAWSIFVSILGLCNYLTCNTMTASFQCVYLTWIIWYWCSLVFWPEGGTIVVVPPPKELDKGGLWHGCLFIISGDLNYLGYLQWFRYMRCTWFINPKVHSQVVINQVQYYLAQLLSDICWVYKAEPKK